MSEHQAYIDAGWKPNSLYVGGYQPPFIDRENYVGEVEWIKLTAKEATTQSKAEADGYDKPSVHSGSMANSVPGSVRNTADKRRRENRDG